jgi:oxygen-independent coproporphyrinogen-3 oxidase
VCSSDLRARRLGRARSSAVAADVVRRVADAVPTFAVDLMFAVPGEGADPLRRDLDAALALGAPHVSLYGLTIEEGTRFARAAARGALVPVDADAWRATYDAAVAHLRGAGVDRYEVSNFARPGHESAHNLLYWSDAPYLGLGPSAHGYLPDGTRTVDVAALDAWLATPDGTATTERPTGRARATDLLVSALRSVRGVDRDHLRARTGLDAPDAVVAALARAGLLRAEGRRIALTDAGFPVCDAVVAHLVDRLA